MFTDKEVKISDRIYVINEMDFFMVCEKFEDNTYVTITNENVIECIKCEDVLYIESFDNDKKYYYTLSLKDNQNKLIITDSLTYKSKKTSKDCACKFTSPR